MAVDGETFGVLPATHRSHAALQIRGDLFPRIEAIALRVGHRVILCPTLSHYAIYARSIAAINFDGEGETT